MTKINQITLDPIVPQGGTIRETIGWAADVPTGEHTFYLISVYGTGVTRGEIVANAVAISSIQVLTSSASRTDDVDTITTGVPLGTYSCATIIAENFDGSTISGIYDEQVDADVLTVVIPIGATIISTAFAAV